MADRTVHAWGDSAEVVRYDRAGKWWIEPKVGSDARRSQVTLTAAVEKALWLWRHDNGSVNFGRTGGNQFDARVRKASRPPTPTPVEGGASEHVYGFHGFDGDCSTCGRHPADPIHAPPATAPDQGEPIPVDDILAEVYAYDAMWGAGDRD